MEVIIEKSRLSGSVASVPSKSDAHRALIASALADAPCALTLPRLCEDTEATLGCLCAMGAEATHKGGVYTLTPIEKNHKTKEPQLHCRESGSTLRFLLPVAAAFCERPRFLGEGRLSERPIWPLLRALRSHGVEADAPALPFTLHGSLRAGEYHVPGSLSSQFVSGLLFALPLLDGDSHIHIEGGLVSAQYVDMTLNTLARFHVRAEKNEDGFFVPGGQGYLSPERYQVEGDWSSAAFFLGADALMGGGIGITGLCEESAQPDRSIGVLLKELGGEIDVSPCPDLFPILAVCAAFHAGRTRFVGGARLRLKESDRIAAMRECLRAMGADVTEHPDGMEIFGGKLLHGAKLHAYNDHRIAMAMSIAGTVTGKMHIHGAQCVKKSYPTFYEDFKKLGGRFYVL